jgi:protease I
MSSWKVLEGKKVAVLTETEFIGGEIDYYRHCFPLLGAEVHFMAHLWGEKSRTLVSDVTDPIDPMSELRTMTVDIEVADRDPDDYDLVIQCANYTAVRLREIPPMGSHGSVEETRSAPAVKFFAEAMRNKRVVKGAMCHALWILTPYPELLRDRKVICHTVVLADIHNAGATYAPNEKEVVVDDDLVTARSFANMAPYFEAMVDQVAARSAGRG